MTLTTKGTRCLGRNWYSVGEEIRYPNMCGGQEKEGRGLKSKFRTCAGLRNSTGSMGEESGHFTMLRNREGSTREHCLNKMSEPKQTCHRVRGGARSASSECVTDDLRNHAARDVRMDNVGKPINSTRQRSCALKVLSSLAIVVVLLTPSVLAKHEAKVHTSECSYTLVVNEFDVSKCPVMQADAMAQDSAHRWGTPKSSSLYANSKEYGGRFGLSRDEGDRQDSLGGGGTGGKDVDVLKNQVRELEGRLLEEMVRSREINSTLARHSAALSAAESRIAAYASNFTSVFRAMMFVQRQLRKQRKINKSLNKKLSNVLLDVVEVNNVLTRVPTSPQDGTVTTSKNFDVQSVARTKSCPGVTDKSTMYRDCAAVFEGGHKQSGVYYVKPGAAACPVPVWCDMDTPPGGWLVFQRRQDGSVSFKHNWEEYKDGFGNVAGEHWLGNDNIFLLSNQDHYQLRVDLWDFTGNRVHAVYSTFRVGGERDLYQLTLTGYTGSAQDSLYRHNHMSFSTPDRDNDGRKEAHCAAEWEAGWWFNNCWFALLNGAYHNRSDVQYRGIAWNHWKREQLRKTEMKIRPVPKLNGN